MLIRLKSSTVLFLCIVSTSLLSTLAKDNKYAVLVVGVPRSGTSCVSGVLNILGVDFGDNLCGANAYNEKGGYEDTVGAKLSREILDDLGMTSRNPRVINWEKEPKKQEFKTRVKKFIKENHTNSFGIKLPLISLILPVYLESVQELGFKPKIIVVIRNPNEIAESWYARWKDSKEASFSAIAKYYFNILKYTRNHDSLIIYFDDVINNTESVINEINSFLPGLKSYNQAKAQLTEFIDQELKHHNARKYLRLLMSITHSRPDRNYFDRMYLS